MVHLVTEARAERIVPSGVSNLVSTQRDRN